MTLRAFLGGRVLKRLRAVKIPGHGDSNIEFPPALSGNFHLQLHRDHIVAAAGAPHIGGKITVKISHDSVERHKMRRGRGFVSVH